MARRPRASCRYNGAVNRWTLSIVVALALLLAGGCAAPTTSTSAPRTQTRCLSQGPPSAPTGSEPFSTRPLIFLFCIQGP